MKNPALSALEPAFGAQIEALLNRLSGDGIEMRPYFAIRTPMEQAALWRQSRSAEEIRASLSWLKTSGAPYLASQLEAAGKRFGPPVTNALPGLSWHQWGEAVDCFWLVDGKAEWSSVKRWHGFNGYQVYARSARQAGLAAGGLWPRLKDWPHLQKREAPSPLAAGMTLAQIDREMRKRFSTAA